MELELFDFVKLFVFFIGGMMAYWFTLIGRRVRRDELYDFVRDQFEIYRGYMEEEDKHTTTFKRGKNRGAFFAYKSLLDYMTNGGF